MNLVFGTKIGRYEIRSLLGAGGMGEVYSAFDEMLERAVAVKFLKHTDDAEKLRRFRQEAKAVSALNHPNILTIYEVGEYEDYHYIVSELVAGENLRDAITGKNLSLAEITDIAVQIGNALAAAHRVPIVHRDIKPENIMILPDGYVKVLDFGLAKFVGTEKNLAHDSEAMTASLIQTKAGMILGTVNYMSPEQLRGKPVDERTDIWSLGVVLFEMLTRRRPFTGESPSDVIAAVLEHHAPLAELNPNLPAEIKAIVGKALEKKADNRFQTAQEFVAALKNAKSVAESGNYAAFTNGSPPNSFQSQKTFFTNAERIVSADGENLSGLFIAGTKVRWRVVALLAFGLTAALGFAGWFYVYQPLASQTFPKQMKSRRLTTTGNVTNAAISPDGRFVVYVQNNNGRQSLWLRETDGAAGKELIAAGDESYAGLAFAPDGKLIYYTVFDRNGSGMLKRITLLGSSSQETAKDVDSAISFSPDGKSFAFIRSVPDKGVDRIIVSTVEGNGERVLSQRKRPEFYSVTTRESLSWSPDGKFIACPFGRTDTSGEFMSVAEINVETGAEKPLTETKWHRVGRVAWTKNADELLITAADVGSDTFQIRKVFRSNGNTQNLTGELTDYHSLSLNGDATLLLSVAYDRSSSIYTATSDEPSRLKQIKGGSYDGIGGVGWTADGRIVYVSTESGSRDIWTMNADGANRTQLTTDKAADDSPAISNDGKHIIFVSLRGGTPHIWRMNLNGGDLKQLTDKGGEYYPSITPDGNFVIYSSRTEGRPTLWKIPTEGGEPQQITAEQTNSAAVSPDGQTIACLTRGVGFDSPTELAAISMETGGFIKTFKPAGFVSTPELPAIIRWLPDNRAAAYVAHIDGVSNIWTQPISGGEPKQLTDFTAEKIFSFDWSKDGKQIIYARGEIRSDLVLFEKF